MRTKAMICVGMFVGILALTPGCQTPGIEGIRMGTTPAGAHEWPMDFDEDGLDADVQVWRIDFDGDGLDDFIAVRAGGDRASEQECVAGVVLDCDLPLDVCGVYYCVRPGYLLCYACGDGFCVPNETWCVPGDFDGDGDVDLHDFAVFQNALTGANE